MEKTESVVCNEPSKHAIFAALGISILTRFDTQIFVGYVVTLSRV